MVAIGEKSKKLEQLRSDASRKTKQIKRLENQLETLKEDISKLENRNSPSELSLPLKTNITQTLLYIRAIKLNGRQYSFSRNSIK